jgi:hypothetical protein
MLTDEISATTCPACATSEPHAHRSGVRANPILTARAVAFPEPTRPANHVPTFGKAIPPGYAWCLRCCALVTAKQWAGDTCPGKGSA